MPFRPRCSLPLEYFGQQEPPVKERRTQTALFQTTPRVAHHLGLQLIPFVTYYSEQYMAYYILKQSAVEIEFYKSVLLLLAVEHGARVYGR